MGDFWDDIRQRSRTGDSKKRYIQTKGPKKKDEPKKETAPVENTTGIFTDIPRPSRYGFETATQDINTSSNIAAPIITEEENDKNMNPASPTKKYVTDKRVVGVNDDGNFKTVDVFTSTPNDIPKVETPQLNDKGKLEFEHKANLDERTSAITSNVLTGMGIPLNSGLNDVATSIVSPIIHGAEQMKRGDDEGNVADLLLGAVDIGINVLPSMVGVNAVMPLITQVTTDAGKSIGMSDEETQKLAHLVALAPFGKKIILAGIGANSFAEFTGKILGNTDIDETNKERIIQTASQIGFFGGLGAISLGKGSIKYLSERFKNKDVTKPEVKAELESEIKNETIINTLESDKQTAQETFDNAKTPDERLKAINTIEKIEEKQKVYKEKRKKVVGNQQTRRATLEVPEQKTYEGVVDEFFQAKENNEPYSLPKESDFSDLQDKGKINNLNYQISQHNLNIAKQTGDYSIINPEYVNTEFKNIKGQVKKLGVSKNIEIPKQEQLPEVEITEGVGNQISLPTETKEVAKVTLKEESKPKDESSEKSVEKQKTDKPITDNAVDLSSESKFRIGRSPQTYSVVEKLPFDKKTDLPGEVYVKVKNDKTGAVETVLESDLKPIKTVAKEVKENEKLTKAQKQLTKLESVDTSKMEYPDKVKQVKAIERQKKIVNRLSPKEENVESNKRSQKVNEDVEVKKDVERHIVETPRSELPEFISEKIRDDAEQKLARIEGSEVKRVGSWNTQDEITGESRGTAPFTLSSFPKWFSDLGTNKKSVITALQKIIEDNGKDKGVVVERVKEKILKHLKEGQSELENSTLSVVSGESTRHKAEPIPKDEEVSAYLEQFKNNKVTIEDLHKAEQELTSFNPEEFESGKEVVNPVKKYVKENINKGNNKPAEQLVKRARQDKLEKQRGADAKELKSLNDMANHLKTVMKKYGEGAYKKRFEDVQNKIAKLKTKLGENEGNIFDEKQDMFDKSQITQQGIPIGKEQFEKFYKSDIRPKVVGALRLWDSVRKTFTPSLRGEEAKQTASELRINAGKLAREDEMILSKLEDARKTFNKLSNKTNLDLIDIAETGGKFQTPEMTRFFGNMQKLLNDRWEKIKQIKGTDAFIENYFPHVWKDPAGIKNEFAKLYSNKTFQGSKSFLKKRTIPTTKEGIEAGFEPVTYNPVDLAMAKLHEMNKLILSHEAWQNLKESKLAKFYKSFKDVPEGWTKVDDKIGTVFGDPNITVKEYVDTKKYEQLENLAKDLNLDHKRKTNLRGKRLGYASRLEGVRTKFATPLGVLTHEIGHHIEWKYNFRENLIGKIEGRGKRGDVTKVDTAKARSVVQKELRALADLRYEGSETTDSYKKYVREWDEKMANMVDAYVNAPEKFKQVAPKTYKYFSDIVKNDKILKQLDEIKPSLVLSELQNKVNVGGTLIHGYWYMPEAAAKVFNNNLSPGLKGKPGFELIRQSGNLLNQIQLGFSAFHLSFTSLDSALSRFALGEKQISKGKFLKGISNIATSPIAPVTNFLKGQKLFKDYQKEIPTDPALVKAIEQAGGRIRMDKFYINNSVKNFTNALKDNNYFSALFKLPGAMTELLAKPIMEVVVPRQKLGVFSDLATDILEDFNNGKITEEQKISKLQKAWDSVDNRMGQLVYDNLFWNRTVKDMGLASVRSLGWNLGTIREVGGGLVDIPRYAKQLVKGNEGNSRFEISDRMAYITALPLMVGTIGATINYLSTGEAPKDMKDYFFPRTGNKKPDGSDERVSLPSYMKDLWAYAEDPILTASHKIHPVFGMITQMLDNKDYFGYEIRDKNDTYLEQGKQVLNYLGEQYKPFSIRNLEQRKKAGDSFLEQMQSFVGITPAPKYITNTDIQKKIEKRFNEVYGNQTKTLDQKQKDEIKKHLKELYKSDPDEYEKQSQEALQSGVLTKRMLDAVEDTTPTDIKLFKRLPKTDKDILKSQMSESQRERYLFGNNDVVEKVKLQKKELESQLEDLRTRYSISKDEAEKEKLSKSAQEVSEQLAELKKNPILIEVQKKTNEKTKTTKEIQKEMGIDKTKKKVVTN